MAYSRQRRRIDEPRDIFVYDPEVPVLAPGGAAASSGQFDQASAGARQQSSRLHHRAAAALAVDFRHSARRRSIAPLPRPIPTSPPSWCACGRTAPRSSSASASPARAGFSRKPDTSRTKFITGSSTLEPTSCRFAAGDRIRLEIASSAFPLYDRNPGTDVPSCRATSWDWQRSTQIVYHSGEYPSALYLPVSEARGMTDDVACRKSKFAGVSKSYGGRAGA